MKRTLMTIFMAVMLVVMPAVTPAMASGGAAPPIEGAYKILGPKVEGTVVIGFNEVQKDWGYWAAYIRVETQEKSRHGDQDKKDREGHVKHAQRMFVIPGFPLYMGCQLVSPEVFFYDLGPNLAEVRFLNVPLAVWMGDVVIELFNELGIQVSGATVPVVEAPIPVITQIKHPACTPAYPYDFSKPSDGSWKQGILTFDAVIKLFQSCDPAIDPTCVPH